MIWGKSHHFRKHPYVTVDMHKTETQGTVTSPWEYSKKSALRWDIAYRKPINGTTTPKHNSFVNEYHIPHLVELDHCSFHNCCWLPWLIFMSSHGRFPPTCRTSYPKMLPPAPFFGQSNMIMDKRLQAQRNSRYLADIWAVGINLWKMPGPRQFSKRRAEDDNTSALLVSIVSNKKSSTLFQEMMSI